MVATVRAWIAAMERAWMEAMVRAWMAVMVALAAMAMSQTKVGAVCRAKAAAGAEMVAGASQLTRSPKWVLEIPRRMHLWKKLKLFSGPARNRSRHGGVSAISSRPSSETQHDKT